MSHNTKMPEGLLPLFPLEVVLFPNTSLPLHIFEDRYKEMINECITEDRAFGIVLSRGNGVLRTGTTAAVEQVLQRFEDGRLDILTLGRRRFEILSIQTDRNFFQAEVQYFDDDDQAPASLQTILRALEQFEELVKLTGDETETPEADHPELSFQLAQISTDLSFRQTLLQMRSEADRMEQVREHLAVLLERHKLGKEIRKVARLNGHGKHTPDLSSLE
ncbi:LON peptidase substrate-binding domain-containing protein [Paludibaculum fermentans]|uniref:LON peptidase substrate-binding domain-containing protein n=1 Tax=Paludibaculum fermentans TaxID=1473598 RepID=A0A7S7NKE3_PALFE|nr:LON peptidase substrate-binding domain-containing protein [Paludibaculum fermentans]QOY85247.1 LON peptidase substrate-binding domain-containing protein [Paludibaculum fermentans]